MANRAAPERAEFFDPSHAGYFGDHAARYEFAAHLVRDKRVIDAACGSGYGSMRLKLAGASMCLGIDLDGATILRNQNLYGRQGVEYLQADCETFDYAAHKPDVIVSFETIEHLKHTERFLDSIRPAVGNEGAFLVSCPNDEELGDNPYHLHSWNGEEFRSLLSRYFEDVVLLGQVQTPASRTRYEFGRYLDSRLGVLWNQPWTRVWRGVRRALGRPPVAPRPDWCGFLPGQHDWWFVPNTGQEAMSLLAICRRARPSG